MSELAFEGGWNGWWGGDGVAAVVCVSQKSRAQWWIFCCVADALQLTSQTNFRAGTGVRRPCRPYSRGCRPVIIIKTFEW